LSGLELREVPKIVNAALKAKAIEIGVAAEAWPRPLHYTTGLASIIKLVEHNVEF